MCETERDVFNFFFLPVSRQISSRFSLPEHGVRFIASNIEPGKHITYGATDNMSSQLTLTEE